MEIKRITLILFMIIYPHLIATSQPIVRTAEPRYGTLPISQAITTVVDEAACAKVVTFRSIQSLAVDSVRRIYLRDVDRIYKFDPEGRYLGEFGRLGQGPGEYQAPVGVFVDSRDRIYIVDQGMKIIIYDKNGGFLESWPFESMMAPPFFVGGDGWLTGFSRRVESKGVSKDFVLINRWSGSSTVLSSFREAGVSVQSGTSGGVVGGFKHPLSRDSFACEWIGVGICFGMNLVYELSVFNMEGKLLRKIVNPEAPASISQDKRELIKDFGKDSVASWELPDSRPFFSGFVSDEKGRLYVLRTKSIASKDSSWCADVYDKLGQFIFQTTFALKPECFRQDSYYAIEHVDDGQSSIKRVKVLNFAELPY